MIKPTLPQLPAGLASSAKPTTADCRVRFGWSRWLLLCVLATVCGWLAADDGPTVSPSTKAAADPSALPGELGNDFDKTIRPLLAKYCIECHGVKKQKGELDLEHFSSFARVRQNLKPWKAVAEQVEVEEMPPADKPQPSDDERRQLVEWARRLLEAEARARRGDPGRSPLRRLSHAEYDNTIRDLTGVDLRPTRQFPADGAAGEGFTNAAEALTMSPALFSKYLDAAKDIAAHAVLLPNGVHFSPTKTRRDWTDESLARLRAFYGRFSADGRLRYQPYLAAIVRHRHELLAETIRLEDIAATEKLNAKYLAALWHALTSAEASAPLDGIRARFRTATPADVETLAAEVTAWQTALWKFDPIGSYRKGTTTRQADNNPSPVREQTVKLNFKPAPGQTEVVLYLLAREMFGADNVARAVTSPSQPGVEPTGQPRPAVAVWHQPRFVAPNQPPLFLKDYASYGRRYEIDFAAIFADSARYLEAVGEGLSVAEQAEEPASPDRLSQSLLERWGNLLCLAGSKQAPGSVQPEGASIAPVPLELLSEHTLPNASQPGISGWRAKGADLPVVVSNSTDKTARVPGTIPPHSLAVHPTPTQFVAAAWTSPVTGRVRLTARVAHAHPACGNGVAYWLERRRGEQAVRLSEAPVELGREAYVAPLEIAVEIGDELVLAVEPRDQNHSCDLTLLNLHIVDLAAPDHVWSLPADVADSIQSGNPHADRLGHLQAWRFAQGPVSRSRPWPASGPQVPAESVLAAWREAALDPDRTEDAGRLAQRVQSLLVGARPEPEKSPDRLLYDLLVSTDGPLLRDIDLANLPRASATSPSLGPPAGLFDSPPGQASIDEQSFVTPLNQVLELRLPAHLLRERQLEVGGRLIPAGESGAVQFEVLTDRPRLPRAWDGKSPWVTAREGDAWSRALAGLTEFRRCFPQFVFYPRLIPDDEIVCLKTYHREDEPLQRLFLTDDQILEIDRLWSEHRFISQFPVVENEYLPQFIGFVTQDGAKETVAYYEGFREPFRQRAEEFWRDYEAAGEPQLTWLLQFAERAYRRPLADSEGRELRDLYATLRGTGISHDEAFRSLLVRVLSSPPFLYHIETPPSGAEPGPLGDWELASRLSYFLWSSLPDDELRALAAAGRLTDAAVLEQQTRRMLRDDRVRSLAIEFGTQWLHVRGFDELKEKNERLFPQFDVAMRSAIYEESILFFEDLFRQDRAATEILNADYTFLNDRLATHYGIPGVSGPAWRRVDGVRKFGRGGVLGLASIQSRQSGASRTSPTLRGNWVVETLLGEKLPRPPADVPRLPDEETNLDGLSTREMVERHARVAECAVCHVRIDPFGFALENYDPIGRLRATNAGGTAVDARVRLRDGTEFEGLAGLRTYLIEHKGDVILRLFCRKLLGYAIGREVDLSDQSVLDEMVSAVRREGRVSSAVVVLVRGVPFRSIRGSHFTETHE